MSDNLQLCTSNTKGLILSSFDVLQDSNSQNNMRHMKLKGGFSSVLDDRLSSRNSQYNPSCLTDDGHHISETNDGDEMFDMADQFRADDAGDSLDNDTNNNSLDRDDEGDDEEEEDEEDNAEDDVVRQNDIQGLGATSEDLTSGVDSTIRIPSASSLSELRVHCHQQEPFINHTGGLPAHNFINTSKALWHSGPSSPNSTGRFSGDWHLPTSSSTRTKRRRQDAFSESSSPDEGREGCNEQHWKFLHGQTGDQHSHWVADHGSAKVVVGSVNSSWVPNKREISQEQTHDLQGLHAHSILDRSSHWGQHIRTNQSDLHAWPKGNIYTPESDLHSVRNMFTVQPAQPAQSTPSLSNSYTEIGQAGPTAWHLNTHLPTPQALGSLPRPILSHDLSCRRAGTSNIYHPSSSQGFPAYQDQGCADWTTTTVSPNPPVINAELPAEHYKLGGVERNPVCKSSVLYKHGKGRGVRGEVTAEGHALLRPTLDQVRQQTHPYQMKEQKKVMRDVYPATSANVHTLKASHIVSWYIDYLIHENEHLTQISRAFSLPVNLFHSDDFYFMDSLKKKVHFPSLKFLSWMQQNLPSINVNAIDFHEGRPPVISTWNQDWFWQNKSRRDIIHDVFFYFQHRRVTCEN